MKFAVVCFLLLQITLGDTIASMKHESNGRIADEKVFAVLKNFIPRRFTRETSTNVAITPLQETVRTSVANLNKYFKDFNLVFVMDSIEEIEESEFEQVSSACRFAISVYWTDIIMDKKTGDIVCGYASALSFLISTNENCTNTLVHQLATNFFRESFPHSFSKAIIALDMDVSLCSTTTGNVALVVAANSSHPAISWNWILKSEHISSVLHFSTEGTSMFELLYLPKDVYNVTVNVCYNFTDTEGNPLCISKQRTFFLDKLDGQELSSNCFQMEKRQLDTEDTTGDASSKGEDVGTIVLLGILAGIVLAIAGLLTFLLVYLLLQQRKNNAATTPEVELEAIAITKKTTTSNATKEVERIRTATNATTYGNVNGKQHVPKEKKPAPSAESTIQKSRSTTNAERKITESQPQKMRTNTEKNLRPLGTEIALIKSNKVKDALKKLDKNWIIPFDDLQIIKQIGKGSFGLVYQATWRRTEVAVKQLLPGENITDETFKQFIVEAKFMSKLRPHDNVIQMLGICINPISLVTKFYANGSLLQYLNRMRGQKIPNDIVFSILKGITAGMLHLELEKVVHRDLAARNILLSSNMTAIVSDFGFARTLHENSDSYFTDTEVIPVRWTSPEALMEKIYSSKSDVWSWGVVAWEIMTKKHPYGKLSNPKVIMEVVGGKTPELLEFPQGTSKSLIKLVLKCWAMDPSKRPNFEEILQSLDEIKK